MSEHSTTDSADANAEEQREFPQKPQQDCVLQITDLLCLFTPRRAAVLANSISLGLLLSVGIGLAALQFGWYVGGMIGTASEPFVGMDRAWGDYIGAIAMGGIFATVFLLATIGVVIFPLHLMTKWGARWFGAMLLSQGMLMVPWAIWSYCREIANIAHPNCQIYDWGGKLVKPAWVAGAAYPKLGSWYLTYALWSLGLILAVWALVVYVQLPKDDQPRCQKCHYLLYGLTEYRCPECGTPFKL